MMCRYLVFFIKTDEHMPSEMHTLPLGLYRGKVWTGEAENRLDAYRKAEKERLSGFHREEGEVRTYALPRNEVHQYESEDLSEKERFDVVAVISPEDVSLREPLPEGMYSSLVYVVEAISREEAEDKGANNLGGQEGFHIFVIAHSTWEGWEIPKEEMLYKIIQEEYL